MTTTDRRFLHAVLVLAVLVLAADLSGPAAAAAAPDRSRPGSCGPSPQEPGTSARHTISSQGRERAFQLHLPAGYDGRQDWPLVLAFHGHGSSGAEIEEFSKLSTLPAVVAYPDGVIGQEDERRAWQGAPYAAPGVDDVAFTADLLDHLQSTLCVDERDVHATGKSNGGGFTGLLACRMADRIAAIAPVAGAFYPGTREDCRPSRPVPVIAFHGTADTTTPYTGEDDRGLPAVPDWAAGWAERNGCHARPPAQRIEPDITIARRTGCSNGAEVRLVTVADGGHRWPGADMDSGGSGTTTQTIEAHEVLWEFMREQEGDLR